MKKAAAENLELSGTDEPSKNDPILEDEAILPLDVQLEFLVFVSGYIAQCIKAPQVLCNLRELPPD